MVTPREWGVTTIKGDKLYVHILDLEDNVLFLPLKDAKVKTAVDYQTGKRIKFTQDKDGVVLKLGQVPTAIDHIVEITLR